MGIRKPRVITLMAISRESSASTVRKFQRIQQPGMSIDESRGGIDGAKRNHSRPGQSGPRDVTRYHPREFSCSLVHMERELMTETYITMRKKEEGNGKKKKVENCLSKNANTPNVIN
ncbi:hypothetical protein PV328_007500 [Microctonus aethiopoides]|uniref:Uncharacterized protein n=1 Tax=Microctonus aethiopoides TaxID=144406 RepID=A0AA39C9N3_9HYME|nr:hypothetical protein PV328_007500 [Microctonus aethiopoides]